jgi:hypothetical protein
LAPTFESFVFNFSTQRTRRSHEGHDSSARLKIAEDAGERVKPEANGVGGEGAARSRDRLRFSAKSLGGEAGFAARARFMLFLLFGRTARFSLFVAPAPL